MNLTSAHHYRQCLSSFNAFVHWKVNDLEASDSRRATDRDIGFPVGAALLNSNVHIRAESIDGARGSKEECKLHEGAPRGEKAVSLPSGCLLRQRSRDYQFRLCLTRVCESACMVGAQPGFVLSRAPISSITVSHPPRTF